MPVARVARQSGHFQSQHDSGSPQAHLCNQPLKTFSVGGRSSRLSEVGVNDDDSILGPAQRHGLLAQRVLTFRAFAVFEDLTQRRLPDVEIGIPLEMNSFYFLMRVWSHDLASWQLCISIPARIRTTSVRTP